MIWISGPSLPFENKQETVWCILSRKKGGQELSLTVNRNTASRQDRRASLPADSFHSIAFNLKLVYYARTL
jgi:hypothetical protein